MLPGSRRRISRDTVELIRELVDEENRLREQLGIEPARPVTFPDYPSLGGVAPAPVRRLSRGRRVRGLMTRLL